MVKDFAVGELGLTIDEFYSMTQGNYARLSNGFLLRETNDSRKLRMVVAAQVGKSPRSLWELPGDWDETPRLMSQDENEAILNKLGCLKILRELSNGKGKGITRRD